MSNDFSGELRTYANDLGKITGDASREVDKVLKKGAQNIKEDLVKDAKASKHFKGLAPAISYDSLYGFQNPRYEIGPDKARKEGPLGNIAYFGTSRGGGTLDLEGPLERESKNLETELDRAVGRMVKKL